jgi:RNA polymerase sigma-70 factor (ECF subfamily)
MSEPSDQSLVERAAAGDAVAFARLVERHYDLIHRVAYRCCGDRSDAEDLAQDVCVRLGTSIRGFRAESSLTTWLYAVTLNAAQLPDKQRDAVLLVYGEDMAHAEAARVMGCKEATVSWHVHEARKRLKRLMQGNDDDRS